MDRTLAERKLTTENGHRRNRVFDRGGQGKDHDRCCWTE